MAHSEWLSSRFFQFVHGNHLVYNTCWEDRRIDRIALRLAPDDTVLVITSAGCNASDYSLAGTRQIIAVDMNPRQNALLELKLAGIRNLEYEKFFPMFGLGRLEGVRSVYARRLRAALSPWAQSYWDRHIQFFEPGNLRPFYFRGTCGAQRTNSVAQRRIAHGLRRPSARGCQGEDAAPRRIAGVQSAAGRGIAPEMPRPYLWKFPHSGSRRMNAPWSDLRVLYHLALKPVRGNEHKNRLESFHAGQAGSYDDFRRRLLPGRRELYSGLPVPPGGIWVDLGGGTGAGLEWIGPSADALGRVFVVDLSPSLLSRARRRIAANRWANVEAVEADAAAFAPPQAWRTS